MNTLFIFVIPAIICIAMIVYGTGKLEHTKFSIGMILSGIAGLVFLIWLMKLYIERVGHL